MDISQPRPDEPSGVLQDPLWAPPVQDLSYPTLGATVTQLSDGTLLVAGGQSELDGMPSAAWDRYDPNTGLWLRGSASAQSSADGGAFESMGSARKNHTATRLKDGRVLVTGGETAIGAGTATATVEVFDPSNNGWTTISPLPAPRTQHTATLLPSGRVLIVGGLNASGTALGTALLFNPATNTFAVTGALTTARGGHRAVKLQDDTVLAISGSALQTSVERYSPTTGQWTAAGGLTTGRRNFSATVLSNGDVLVAGGSAASGFLTTCERFSPTTNQWTASGSLQVARARHGATRLPSGNVLVAGGDNTTGALASAETWDPATGQWTTVDALDARHGGTSLGLLANGRAIVIGGSNGTGGDGGMPATAVELYDPTDGGFFSSTGGLRAGRADGVAIPLPSGLVLVAGGTGAGGALASAELFSPDAGTFTFTGTMQSPRTRFAATLLPDGKVLVAGGQSGATVLSSAETFDPASGTWSAAGAMGTARRDFTATTLPDGKVLVVGGTTGAGALATAELYTPELRAWSAAAAPQTARRGHVAALLPTGEVLIAAGVLADGGATMATERFQLDGGWRFGASFTSAMGESATSVVLPSGQVLVAGGEVGGTPMSTAFVLGNSLSDGGIPSPTLHRMPDLRSRARAVLMPNGKVLLAGGRNSGGPVTQTMLFNPANAVGGFGAADTWETGPALSLSRDVAFAALLSDSRALIAGGSADAGIRTSAQTYNEGRGAQLAWTPRITSAPAALAPGATFSLEGTLLDGVSEGGRGGVDSFSSNIPLVELQNIGSGHRFVAPVTGWSDGGVSARLPASVPGGYYALWVVAGGAVSDAVPLAVDPDPPLLVTGAPTSLAPQAPAVTLAVSGGLPGYAWGFVTNASGATFDTGTLSYRPGGDGGVVDVIRVTDRRGHVATVSITVTSGVSVAPATITTGPGTSVSFSASGGSNTGFTWALETNTSGGTIDGGAYRAGPTGNSTDTVRATDAFGNVGRATVLVGPPLAISPPAPTTPPLGTVQLNAFGGSGGGYIWSIPLPDGGWGADVPDGGNIGSTGQLRAGPTGPFDQTARVVDSVGTVATVTVRVTEMVQLSPSDATTSPLGSEQFTATGGSGTGFTWTLISNQSGGNVTMAGRYTAGMTPGTDVIEVVDSLGNRATVTVRVTNALAVTPSQQTVAPRDSLTLRASGGSDAGYTWTLLTPDSGSTFNPTTAVYTAGTASGAIDEVRVSDSLTAVTARLTIGPGVSTVPTSVTVHPRESRTFLASGGKGSVPADYTWSLSTNGSTGTITSAGVYTAGQVGPATDVARAVDSLGNAATVAIAVTPSISIAPAVPSTPPNGPIEFSATGGSNGGWVWTLTAAPSGGTIDPFNGRYRAGATGSVSDVVEVRDSAGNTATVSVIVGGPLAITPASTTRAPRGTVAFVASGGSGTGYQWSLLNNNSNGTIDATSGLYQAGATGDVIDTVQLVDSVGGRAQATISVTTALVLTPLAATVPPRGSIPFAAMGGAPPLTFSLVTDRSGGRVDALTGLYTAGATGSRIDEVQVADDTGASLVASISVTEGVTVMPDNEQVPPAGRKRFTATGGDPDGGYRWTLATDESGGTIDPDTGDYQAGALGGVSDVVMATDPLGNSGVATVTVTSPETTMSQVPFTQRPPVSGWSCGCGAGASELGALPFLGLALALLRRRSRGVAVVALVAVLSAPAVAAAKKPTRKAPAPKAKVAPAPPTPVPPTPTEPAPLPAPEPIAEPAPRPAARKKPSMMVLDVDVSSAGEKLDSVAFSELVVNSVAGSGMFTVLSSQDMVKILGVERQRQLLGCAEDQCMSDIATAAGSDLILAANVGKVGDVYVVSTKLIEASGSRIVGRSSLQAAETNALPVAVWNATQAALDDYGTGLPSADAERWAKRARQAPPAEVVAQLSVPNFFGVTVLAVGGLQVLSDPGNRGSIGGEVDLTFRRGRFDLFAGVIVGRNIGARIGAGWALIDSRFRLGLGLRGTAYPGLMLFGGGLGLNADFAINRVFSLTAVGAGEVYPTPQSAQLQQPPVVALLGALGVSARF